MNAPDLNRFTAADLADPGLEPSVLAQLAQHRPDLWPSIRRHPQCYRELAGWIDQQLSTWPSPASAQATPHLTTEEWAAAFQRDHGREPTLSEYRAMLASGAIRRLPEESAPQVSAGQQSWNRPVGSGPDLGLWAVGAPFVLMGAAFVGIFSLFLPIVSVLGVSVNSFNTKADGDGPLFLFAFLATIGAAVAAVAVRATWSSITAGVIGVLVGILGVIYGFGNLFSISDTRGVSVGFGLVLLAFASVFVLTAAALLLFSLWRHRAPRAAGQQFPASPASPR